MAQEIRDKIDKEFKDLPKDLKKILYIAKYIVEDATISGYQLMSVDRLMIFLLLQGEDWRSHKCKSFQYIQGCWQEQERISMPSLDFLTAAEGLFIELSKLEIIPWIWSSVKLECKRINQNSGLPNSSPD